MLDQGSAYWTPAFAGMTVQVATPHFKLHGMGKRGEDDEDAALWARVAESAKPLTKDRARGTAPVVPRPVPKRKPASPPAPKPAAKPAPNPIHVPPGPSFDRQVARKLD